MKKIISILFISIFTASFAHGIWAQINNRGKVNKEAKVDLFFGELNHNLIERGSKWYAGVMFKDFKANLKSQDIKKTVALNLQNDENSMYANFIPTTVGIHQITAFNEDSPVRDVRKHGLGMLKDSIYLRTTFEATSYREKQKGEPNLEPMMYYDIVPFPAKNGFGTYDSHKSSWRVNEKVHATFYIDYKIAAHKEVKVKSPDGWLVVKKTNAKGEFSFTPYKEGVYQAIYQTKTKKKGVFKNEKYDTTRVKVVLTMSVE